MKTEHLERTYAHEGNLAGETIAMGIDQTALAHIMGVLTDLYSDRRLATIRETSTNAKDAHAEAGVDRPIAVTLPSEWDPTFQVEDFGVGMSTDDLRKVYSQYGHSTKRDTDAQTGMLGLGCKAPLTYAAQFTLRTRKDGVEVTAVVGRDEQGVGYIKVLAEVETDEGNGTLVSVPVGRDDIATFNEVAQGFYEYWKPGEVLVNGEPPAEREGWSIDPDVRVIPGSRDNVIVMGGVPYTVNYGHRHEGAGVYAIEAEVPMGAVSFTPSREALDYTPKTEALLRDLYAYVREALQRRLTDQLHKVPSATEALRFVVKNERLFNTVLGSGWRSTATWNGQRVPYQFKGYHGLHWRLNASRNSVQPFNSVVVTTLLDAEEENLGAVYGRRYQPIFVLGYTNTTVTPTTKQKVKAYLEQEGLTTNEVYFLAAKALPQPWAKGLDLKTLSWQDDVKPVKLARTSTGTVRTAGTYEVNGYDVAEDEVPTDKPLVFFTPANDDVNNYAVQTYLGSEVNYVSLAKNRWDKFQRLYPEAVHLRTYLERKLAAAKDAMTEDDWATRRLGQVGTASWVQSIAVERSITVLDPAIAEAISLVRRGREGSPAAKALDSILSKAKSLGFYFSVETPADTPDYAEVVTEVTEAARQRYPLIDVIERGYRTPSAAALVEYIDAVYFTRQADSEEDAA